MLEPSKRKELSGLLRWLTAIIFSFGVVVGITIMGISNASAEVEVTMVNPTVMFLRDHERGPKCGMYTDNTILAEAFLDLMTGAITPEQFTDRVVVVDPVYAKPAAVMLVDCGLSRGLPI